MEHFRGMEGPELIEVKDWSGWLRFPHKVGQSEVHNLVREGLAVMLALDGDWEIRPIWPVEEREER